MRVFKVPYAFDEHDVLTSRVDAIKGGPRYRCPGCRSTVDVYEGTRQRHFHHRAALVGSPPCTPESASHWCAKHLIRDVITRWKSGGPVPLVVHACSSEYACDDRSEQPLPELVAQALVEHRLPSGRVVDVALVDNADTTLSAVEVLKSHEIDRAKADALKPLPWIEVDASAILDDALRWMPTQDFLRPYVCNACKQRRLEDARRAEERRVKTARLAEERRVEDARQDARRAQEEAAAQQRRVEDARRAKEEAAEDEADRIAEVNRLKQLKVRFVRAISALPFKLADFPHYYVTGISRCEREHDFLHFGWDDDDHVSPPARKGTGPRTVHWIPECITCRASRRRTAADSQATH